ncbi:sporulation membrane protein YtrI [Pontibacillus yanchengensis]|uniref:Sporulation membrane protein YtrI C-terminal domain-containing protein n=1 Tax=Pontibacillus yanchengensis Y32 TaxID=1385514 RepID=A0A0A2THS2_9BACI|nr:sporulation membrane protein YtrI [Pontibacillus yanchengensis]KGP73621.1 hypothetical protein N782_03075 [Pontibacillus yanchengensis Y32]
MHIPPYYKKRNWQRFLAGVFLGGIIAYAVFLFMYGTYVERWIKENMQLREDINDLQDQYSMLREDKNELDEKQKEKIRIHSVEIIFLNEKKLLSQHTIDRLTIYKLRELTKDQLPDLVGKSITSLSENVTLLYTSIENKRYKIDDLLYELKVERVVISQELKIGVNIIPTKS